MAKDWDSSLKLLVSNSPEDFATWVFEGAKFQEKLSTEFTGQKLEADALLDVLLDGQEVLLQIEFQAEYDPTMGERLLEYSLRAKREHKRPVYSCVIYLRNRSDVPDPPLQWNFLGRTYLEFHYLVIELRKLKPDDLRQSGKPGLLPLMILTNGGANREVAEEIFTSLEAAGKAELLPIAFTLISLAFGKGNVTEQEWLERSFKMHDILKETPIYEYMVKEAREEALKQGREEGLQQALQLLRIRVLDAIAEKFPDIAGEAWKRLKEVRDMDTLLQIHVKVSVAQNKEEVLQVLPVE